MLVRGYSLLPSKLNVHFSESYLHPQYWFLVWMSHNSIANSWLCSVTGYRCCISPNLLLSVPTLPCRWGSVLWVPSLPAFLRERSEASHFPQIIYFHFHYFEQIHIFFNRQEERKNPHLMVVESTTPGFLQPIHIFLLTLSWCLPTVHSAWVSIRCISICCLDVLCFWCLEQDSWHLCAISNHNGECVAQRCLCVSAVDSYPSAVHSVYNHVNLRGMPTSDECSQEAGWK